jgi:hypothetical protein
MIITEVLLKGMENISNSEKQLQTNLFPQLIKK